MPPEVARNNSKGSTDPSWRWPHYKRLMSQCLGSSNLPLTDDVVGWPPGVPAVRLGKAWSALTQASFIEWKYYAFLNPSFHGIVGLSLYNPDQRFSRLAEGGLLVVVAGQAGDNHPHPFVVMRLLPTAALEGLDGAQLRARHKGLDLDLFDDTREERSTIRLEIAGELSLLATVSNTSPPLDPLVARSKSPLPLGHWVVHNRVPAGRSSGSLQMTPASSTGRPAITARWEESSAYFEHSWGLHPLPWQGWDFMFAAGKASQPDETPEAWAALQSYKDMPDLKRLDLGWTDASTAAQHASSFRCDELNITWPEQDYDVPLAAWVPRRRVLSGRNQDYQVRLENIIDTTLRFLRPETFAVRCFFIAEQLGRVRWTLTSHSGQLVAQSPWMRAGGEVAYARFPSLGRVTRPFPVP